MYPDFVPEAVDYVVGTTPAGEDPEQYDDIAAFHAGFLAETVTNSGPADNLTALNKETVREGVVEQVGEATGIQTMGNGSSSGSGSSSSSENNFTTHPFSANQNGKS